MSDVHKLRIANNRRVVNVLGGGEFTYKPCACEYGKDHDDHRSLTGQDKTITENTNDMLQVAKRVQWELPPKELDYAKHWLQSGGEFKNGKLQPVPFADEITRLISHA